MWALAFLLLGFPLQDTPRTSLRAYRVEEPPLIDGHLDEPVWKSAEAAANFRQIEPDEGSRETERRRAVSYHNLHF